MGKPDKWYFLQKEKPWGRNKIVSDSWTVCWEIYLSYPSNFSLLQQQKENLRRQFVFKTDQKTIVLCQTAKVLKAVFIAHLEKLWIFNYFRGRRGERCCCFLMQKQCTSPEHSTIHGTGLLHGFVRTSDFRPMSKA